MTRRLVSIGEVMIEMSPRGGDAESWSMGVAGDTLNTAWYARALLGGDWTVSYFTALGADRYSGMIRDFLAASGIDAGSVRTVPERRPGLYIIHQQDGDRHFTYWRDTSAAKLLADDLSALEQALSGAGVVYFSGITLAILSPDRRADLLRAVAAARAAGATVAFDPNIRPALWRDGDELRQALTAAAAVCDIVLPTFGDEAILFGDASPQATAGRYAGLGAGEIVVKNGAEATFVRHAGGSFGIAPRPVADVIDATGAGDSFNGAYLARRLAGAAPEAATREAQRIAGICIAHRGALAPRAALDADPQSTK